MFAYVTLTAIVTAITLIIVAIDADSENRDWDEIRNNLRLGFIVVLLWPLIVPYIIVYFFLFVFGFVEDLKFWTPLTKIKVTYK